MKKFTFKAICIMLALFMVIGCAGCGQEKETTVSSEETDIYGDLTVEYDNNLDTSKDSNDATDGNNASDSKNESSNDKTSSQSNTDKDSATQNNTANGQSSSGDIFKNIPSKLKGSTVKVAHWGDEGGDKYQALAKAFTKATNINVKWQLFNQLSYESDILKQIASGNGPDVVILNDKVPQTYEVAQPLPSIFNVNDGFWNPAVSEYTKFNGKYYFVNSYNSPFTIGSLVVYNKKIFSQNGIKSPLDYYNEGNGVWSYEDLKKCMQDATAKGFYGGIIDPVTIAAQMGASMFNYDAKTGKVSLLMVISFSPGISLAVKMK